jgi:hypothetical protein
MRQPRRGSTAYKVYMEMQEEERLRPKSNTNWSSPTTNFFKGLNLLRGALASGENAKLEKRLNEECAYPIRVNPKAPWKEQVSKKFRHKVWVVVLYYNYPKVKVPVAVHVLNVLAYPLKFIPRRSVLQMEEYTNYSYRVGSVINGFQVEFQIPKKFSFEN